MKLKYDITIFMQTTFSRDLLEDTEIREFDSYVVATVHELDNQTTESLIQYCKQHNLRFTLTGKYIMDTYFVAIQFWQ